MHLKFIKFFECKKNTNGSKINDLIKHSRGKYIAFLNSDDFWTKKTKLENQVSFLENNPKYGLCFTKVKLVNSENIFFDKNFENKFQFNLIENEIDKPLKNLFYHGNYFCFSSALIKKNVIKNVGEINHSLQQLGDFDLWLRCAKIVKIKVLNKKMTAFRITSNNASNLGWNKLSNYNNELFFIANKFLDNINYHDLNCNFELKFKNKNFVAFEKALLLYNHPIRTFKFAGLLKFSDLMQDNKSKEIIINRYKFSIPKMQETLSQKFIYFSPLNYLKFCVINLLKKNTYLYTFLKNFVTKLKN